MSSEDNDTKALAAEVDAEVHENLKEKLDHGEISELLRRVAETVAYGGTGDKRTIFDERIEMKREELDTKRYERKIVDTDIDRLEQELRELERKREQVETKEEQFMGEIKGIERRLRAGELPCVFTDHAEIANLKNEYGRSKESIIDLLRERNPDVPEYAFVDNLRDQRAFSGFSDVDQVTLPVGQRESISFSD